MTIANNDNLKHKRKLKTQTAIANAKKNCCKLQCCCLQQFDMYMSDNGYSHTVFPPIEICILLIVNVPGPL